MRLRKQLLIISLVTLGLPWVGCQSVREMDGALKRGQTDALSATARAVAARIGSDLPLQQELAQNIQHPDREQLYVHRLKSQNHFDGYDDDWISAGLGFSSIHPKSEHQVVAGRWDNHINLFVRIKSKQVRYFNPSATSLDGANHIVVHLKNHDNGTIEYYAIYASNPGIAHVSKLLTTNDALTIQQREHRIKAHWLEQPEGFQIELRMPWEMAKQGLNISINSDSDTAPPALGSPSTELKQLIVESSHLANELSVFSSGDTRLHILSPQQYLIASAGAIHIAPETLQPHGFLTWVYSLALGNRTYPDFSKQTSYGKLKGPEISSAVTGLAGKSWYTQGNNVLARIAEPIKDSQGTLHGVIIAEQSASTMASMTNQAFSKLLAYSFLASMAAAVCLVVYATWLSIRIRKLNEAAANAINENGKITDSFPVLGSGDELGELSKSYAQLLTRLREYTNYLRTLSSKLSHELRTPLAIVKSSLDNLEHEPLDKQAKVYAERAREGTSRLSNILNAMSAASRVEQAIEGSEREIIPCDELLRNLKAAYEDVYQEVDFQLKIRGNEKDLQISGSGELLVQALDKLVDNAADFCPKEGLVELGLYRHQDSVVFTVRNEGPPLPSHMHGQLFDSMVSVRDKTSTESSHHLGLGLYIVSLITDFHNGEVQGYNVPDNSGVIFEVRLPAV